MTPKAGALILTTVLYCSFSITGNAQMYQSDYSDPGYWLNMIEEWRKAVEQHRPGEADSAAVEIGSWPTFELELSIELVTKLFSRPLHELSIPPKLGCRALADYLGIKKEEDRNYWLKRGALLHSDIALLRLEKGTADPRNYWTQLASINNAIKKSKKRQEKTCWSIRLLSPAVLDLKDKGGREGAWIEDGKPVYENEGRHMEFGRLLLDSVTPNPSQDEMVKEWYIATTACGLSRGRPLYIERHLNDAVTIFQSDAWILFYAGVLHETYATPRYQNAPRLNFIKYSHGLKKTELELARKFFQRAVTVNPNFAEARLRLGHVSGLLGYHDQAASELQTAAAALKDPQIQYYAALFLGNELAALGRTADARKQFEQAAALYPAAQSPLLALSELAHSDGDIRNAAIEIERAFAVAAYGRRRNDPRWKYDLVPEDQAAALLLKMRKAFGELSR
jgi:tetratricopeptide (TPR) repeat protein